jgi:hypothetical protein
MVEGEVAFGKIQPGTSSRGDPMTLAVISLVLAAIPAGLFLINLRSYRTLPTVAGPVPSCSVLIPARNEAHNIGGALRSVLQNSGVDFEIIVLDDGSTDDTARIVRAISDNDKRVRLEPARPLPPGWAGKNFACAQLARLAHHHVLIFMDADVRTTRPDSLGRLVRFLEESGAGLVSGVPHQQTGTFLEKIVVPLIHFVLLGFLPMAWMRRTRDPRFAAACGQVIAVRRSDYEEVGGHSAVRQSLHDGIALARAFRNGGYRTDLFDGTDTLTCRMYRNSRELWRGFAKNAQEGLGSPRLLLPASLFLLGGQVLPFLLLAMAFTGPIPRALAAAGSALVLLPRLVAARRFRQSLPGALLHPLGVIVLLAIQWHAFFRSLGGKPAIWKERAYHPACAT